MKNYKKLIVWQKSIQLTKDIYRLVKLLPKEETYGLSDQMRRAAISVPSNISEGNARDTQGEVVHFLSIAQGSLAELETQLILCSELEYIPMEKLSDSIALCDEISRMRSSLKTRISKQNK